MSVISEEYINKILSKIASICNLTEWKYSLQKFESIAQNYFGVLIPLVLTGKNDSKEDVNIQLVLKLAPSDERYRVSGAVTIMFAREVFIYSNLLKKYQELQQNFLETKYIVPKCYYVCNEYCNEVIAMQDMSGEGYKPYTSSIFLDLNHIIISLKALAKFHALSFILRERDIKSYEEVAQICLPLSERNNKRFIDILKDRLTKAIQKFENSSYVPLLAKLLENCVKYVESTFISVKATCVCHGDIWKENILFKYKDNIPVAACLIDYQTTRICSPAFDTLYLITCSTDTELRHKYFDKLLDIYYQAFNETLVEAGLTSRMVYSREALDNDLKVVGPACFIVANTALWLFNGLQEEGHVRSKKKLVTEEEKAEAVNQYKTIIRGIMDDFNIYGYIW